MTTTSLHSKLPITSTTHPSPPSTTYSSHTQPHFTPHPLYPSVHPSKGNYPHTPTLTLAYYTEPESLYHESLYTGFEKVIMSEVTFAKSYLATLDKRPIKLPADHAADPRKYPNQSPFTLPRQPHPYPKPSGPTPSQLAQTRTITATLKPMRSTSSSESIKLPNIALDATIHDLKREYAQQSGLPIEKIKLLLNKKPAADLKTLKELGVEGDVDFGVMVMGGAGGAAGVAGSARSPSPAVEEKTSSVPQPAAATGEDKMNVDSGPGSEKAQAEAEDKGTDPAEETARSILQTEEFWADLKGFLAQRLRDQGQSEKLSALFREAWEKR